MEAIVDKQKREAEHQLDTIKQHLAQREQEFLTERTNLMKQQGIQ